MTPEILKTVGQVAGIGGLALGIFLLLFRDVIRLKIFPKLTADHAFRVVVLLLVLVWLVAIAGLGVWAWVTTAERGSRNETSRSEFDGWVCDEHEETVDGELIDFVLSSEGKRVHLNLTLGRELADAFEKLGDSGFRTYSLALSDLPKEPVFMNLRLLVKQGDDFFFGVESSGIGVLRGTFRVTGCAQVGTGWFSCDLQALPTGDA